MRVFTAFQLAKASEMGLRASPVPVTGSEEFTNEICKPLLASGRKAPGGAGRQTL
jgi:hypothetical protein